MRLPVRLVSRLSLAQARDVGRWWNALAEADRRGLSAGCRPRTSEGPRVVARYVDDAVTDDDDETDFYEFIVNHELAFASGEGFRICSAHPEARATLSSGHVPASFVCPLGRASCPMRTMLDAAPRAGCSVQLSRVASS